MGFFDKLFGKNENTKQTVKQTSTIDTAQLKKTPIGQALLNKKVDDEVTIGKPSGKITAYITGIYAARP